MDRMHNIRASIDRIDFNERITCLCLKKIQKGIPGMMMQQLRDKLTL
jgi:hypothetical protein